MRIRMPLVKQKGRFNCGPASLFMVLSYFGDKISLGELETLIGYRDGKGTSSIKLAIAAKKLGYNIMMACRNLIPSEEDYKMDFYKNYADEDREAIKKLVEEGRSLNIPIVKKSLTLKEVLSMLKKDSVPIVLLDWNAVKRKENKGFMGHYVPVVGYDSSFVYVNNSAGKNGMRALSIPRAIFEKARKSRGTDEDIIVIKPKSPG